MAEITAFSARDMANRERLEDYATDAQVSTAAGLNLQIAIVCDGAGGGEVGELAARLTARTVLGYLEISTETSVPKLLVKAVEEANRIVYGELHGAGTSTLALAAIHLDDNLPYGRLYVASVGDSRIYLLRDGQSVRLNIDHTLGNEYIYAGQMTAEETSQLENPNFSTRIIGVGPAVRVDIGFYAERGKDFVNSRRAFHIGQQGMALKEGDTIFVASDGMFGVNDEDSKPFLHEEEILRHALDDDVQRAAQALMRYASARRPNDNISMSMLFVPSRTRKAVRATIRMSPRQRAILIVAVFAVLLLIIGAGFALRQAGEARSIAEQTQVALNDTATVQAYTPTPTITPTSTITPTLRPTFQPGQVGVQYFATDSVQGETPVFELDVLAPAVTPEISRLDIEGPEGEERTTPVDSADVFMQPPAAVEFISVDNAEDRERIEMLLYEKADIFVASHDFVNGGIEIIVAQDERIVFDSHVLCLAAHQLPTATPGPQGTPTDTPKVAFSCYTGPEPAEENCRFRFSRGAETPIPIGSRAVLDIALGELVEIAPIPYEEAKLYYDTIATLVPNSREYAYCFSVNNSYLDGDDDGVPYPDDWCLNIKGSTEAHGCPDADGDGFPDPGVIDPGVAGAIADECPNEAGLPEYNGCQPTPTPTETLQFTNTPQATDTPRSTATRTRTPTATRPPTSTRVPVTPTPLLPSATSPPTATATVAAQCGDGIINGSDQCEPPNSFNCSASCQILCPNGTCDSGENANNCDADCNPVCGNNVVEAGEQCDGGANCDNCVLDGCPGDPLKTNPGLCGCGQPETGNSDTDTFPDCIDNCDFVDNPDQTNSDDCSLSSPGPGWTCDTLGDACDDDDDGDGRLDLGADGVPGGVGANADDNCRTTYNPSQTDTDGDGKGNACDGCPSVASVNANGCPVCGDTLVEGSEECDPPNGTTCSASCQINTPTPTFTPTDTPVPPTATFTPTDTPVPPTATFTPTDTPVPPTATFTPTDTPVPPTNTPVPPTDTPVPPTATP